MKRIWTGAVTAVVLLAVSAAADIIVEPDDFPAGAPLNNAVAGVTLSTVHSDTGDPNVVSLTPAEPFWASTGARVFGHDGSSEYVEHWIMQGGPGFAWGALRADFAAAATQVSLDFIANDPSDYGELQVYGPTGTLLATLFTGELTPAHRVETVTATGLGDIGYVIAGGRTADTVCLDHMVVVPEPAAALGLLLVLGTALRRRG